jgi:lipopolysaccharide biosynthesis glycosyltransferase
MKGQLVKNIVFLVNVKLPGNQEDAGRWADTRSNPYKFSVNSWREWSERNNAEVFVLNDPIRDHSDMPVSWQRYYIFELLEANGIEYDQIMYVDADTIVHPDCPNLFEMSDRKFCFVHNDASYDWVLRSMENYSKYFFNNFMFRFDHYFNSGMLIFNKKHKEFFHSIIEFFDSNKENLLRCQQAWHAGTDQTPANFLTQLLGIEYKILPYEYNMVDLHRKELLQEDMPYIELGWIYHFNSIPNNKDDQLTYYWMEKTFNKLYEK